MLPESKNPRPQWDEKFSNRPLVWASVFYEVAFSKAHHFYPHNYFHIDSDNEIGRCMEEVKCLNYRGISDSK